MEIIFVAALKEETPKLSKFHHTGVGKINASIKLMEIINVYKPTQIISELAEHKANNPSFNIEKVHFFPLGGIKQVSQFVKEI